MAAVVGSSLSGPQASRRHEEYGSGYQNQPELTFKKGGPICKKDETFNAPKNFVRQKTTVIA
jgi:hypothetical protein